MLTGRCGKLPALLKQGFFRSTLVHAIFYTACQGLLLLRTDGSFQLVSLGGDLL